MKIKLEMTIEQAKYLSCICEAFARCGMGQFKDLFSCVNDELNYVDLNLISQHVKNFLNVPNKGIAQQKEIFSCAWDAYQHLRREISWYGIGKDWRTDKREWPEMIQVSYDEPMKTSSLNGDFKTERLE